MAPDMASLEMRGPRVLMFDKNSSVVDGELNYVGVNQILFAVAHTRRYLVVYDRSLNKTGSK